MVMGGEGDVHMDPTTARPPLLYTRSYLRNSLRGPQPILLLGEQRHDGREQFA